MKMIFILIIASVSIFAKDIEISKAFIRLAPPFAQVTAGFLEIKSNYKEKIKLIKVQSSLSKYTEMHDMKMENSKMSMFALDFVNIPANSTVTFQKGSKHIMFINIKDKLVEGETKKIKLFFDNKKTLEVKMKVKKF